MKKKVFRERYYGKSFVDKVMDKMYEEITKTTNNLSLELTKVKRGRKPKGDK